MEPLSGDYKKVSKTLKDEKFGDPLADIMLKLSTMLLESGPDQTNYPHLDHMRNVSLKFKETDRMLESAGIKADATTAPDPTSLKRLSALKFLRHLHLVGKRGGQELWVLSTPKTFRHFPAAEFHERVGRRVASW